MQFCSAFIFVVFLKFATVLSVIAKHKNSLLSSKLLNPSHRETELQAC